MVNINGINTVSNISSSHNTSKRTQYHRSDNKFYPSLKDKKITLNEGSELFARGIINQTKELFTNIINHPIKTAAIIGGTTLGLMSLPLIGISTSVGGGVLAMGFAALSLGNTAIHTKEFIKNNQKGTYDLARKNLEQLGQDTFDSALSVPFIPKAITHIKNFAKFGKININSELLSHLKNSKKLSEKFSIIKSFDKELSRNLNFQNAVEQEFSTLSSLTKSEKDLLRKEFLDYNVPTEKIADVVIDKWALIKGISTKPDIKYSSLPKNTKAIANAADCSITINDYKQNITADFSNFKIISQNLKNNEYIITYQNTVNGSTIVESISKEVLDKYNQLCSTHHKLSPQASRILTIIHEREHIHQFALMSKLKGIEWLKNTITSRGRYLLNNMIEEINNKPQTIEPDRVLSYFYRSPLGTPISYIKETIEIDAREMEYQAIKNPIFKSLNNIFTRTNNANNLSIEKNILINDARIESVT